MVFVRVRVRVRLGSGKSQGRRKYLRGKLRRVSARRDDVRHFAAVVGAMRAGAPSCQLVVALSLRLSLQQNSSHRAQSENGQTIIVWISTRAVLVVQHDCSEHAPDCRRVL